MPILQEIVSATVDSMTENFLVHDIWVLHISVVVSSTKLQHEPNILNSVRHSTIGQKHGFLVTIVVYFILKRVGSLSSWNNGLQSRLLQFKKAIRDRVSLLEQFNLLTSMNSGKMNSSTRCCGSDNGSFGDLNSSSKSSFTALIESERRNLSE